MIATFSEESRPCPWCGEDPLYRAYHDLEWGRPERDPRKLWENLILEGFQAGLSWITILRKREGFRAAFHDFRPEVIARWGAAEVTRLLADPGIVRHRGKIEGTIASARAWLQLEAEDGFSAFVWSFVGGRPMQNRLTTLAGAAGESEASRAMSRALRQRGFAFCGPKTCYSFMQASGLVNDHLLTCPQHAECAALG